MANIPLDYDEILVAQSRFHELQYQHWLQYELFTSQWWVLIAVFIIPWIVWWKLVDKTRMSIILAYGFYMILVISAMNAIGSALQLWIYPIKMLPLIPVTVSIDWGFLTVIHMLIFQYYPRWKSFLIAEVIFAALLAFAGEPFAEWSKLYYLLHWKYIWSFPIYIMKAVIGKWLIESLVFRRQKIS